MKKFYPSTLCALVLFCILSLSFSASAQTYANTYSTTPVLAGSAPYNWNNGAGVPIWEPVHGAPPSTCSNCLIQLIGPGTIHLNTSITLTNNSTLVVGPGVTLEIDNSGQTSTFTGANAVFMDNTSSSTFILQDGTSILNAAAAGAYDGVFITFTQQNPVGNAKQFGNSPSYFTGNTISIQQATPFGNLAVGAKTLNSGSGILPIILSSFEAVLNQGAVDLTWTTATESNSDHFAVQRSVNAGESWDNIGTVAAAGNTNATINYSYTDNKPAQGTSEYRLELVDRDGKYTYSEVKSVRLGIVTSVSIYPNPARDYVNVTLAGNAGESMLVRLFNSAGQLLQEKNVANAGGTTVPLAVSSYPEGNYLIVVSAADGSRQINKLVITK